MPAIKSAACFGGLLVTSAFAQATQAPDLLLPSGSLDGIYALIDRDKDGKYDKDGEAYDFRLDGVNTSIRSVLRVGASFIYVDGGLTAATDKTDKLYSARDSNNNGMIEASERKIYYDTNTKWGPSEPNWLAVDSNGWVWWTNSGGSKEGIYKSKDMNGDGDAEDSGETVAVLVEPTTVTIENTPNTKNANGNRTLVPNNLQSITFDPTRGENGRFICEDETSDQSIAFEDKNNDGDFEDAGECYLFCALYASNALSADKNPDVGTTLSSSNEIRDHAVDARNPKRTIYYLLSADENGANPDAAIIYRGEDKNDDGDVNDKGETTVFWDGSLDSKGATKGYNATLSMALRQGKLYVVSEWASSPDDHDRLLIIEDKNDDGDANDAGETTIAWDLGLHRTHFEPALFLPGTISPPLGKPGVYDYYGESTCRSSLSATSTHNIRVGSSNFNDKCVIGNSNFRMRTTGCKSFAPGIYTVGVLKFANGIPLDPGQTCRVYQSLDFNLLPFVTGSDGSSTQPLPIPSSPGLIGVVTHWQSVVLDAGAPAGLGMTMSRGAEVRFGSYSYSRY